MIYRGFYRDCATSIGNSFTVNLRVNRTSQWILNNNLYFIQMRDLNLMWST